MISLWPEADVEHAARRAFSTGGAEAALRSLGADQPIGADLPLATAVVLVAEAARAGHDFPLAGALMAATVAGSVPAGGAALSDGGPCPCPQGTRWIVVVTEAGAALAGATPGTAATDPLQRHPWAVPAPVPITGRSDLRPLAWVLLAAEAQGAAEAAFALGLDHLKTRRQFGRALGSFQTLRHRAAADWVRLEDMRAAVTLAAHLHAAGAPEFARAARIAKAVASAHAPLIVEHALHAMGAMGFTLAGGLGPALSRVRHASAVFGTAGDHYHALGADYLRDMNTKDPSRDTA